MAERNLDFDRIVDRRNTKSLKYDFAEKRGMPKDLLPLWVADMDFKTSSYVQDALAKQVEHGIFGYSDITEKSHVYSFSSKCLYVLSILRDRKSTRLNSSHRT